jgi:ADP-ribose pyrophosphatase YjhB (NUDIX family)
MLSWSSRIWRALPGGIRRLGVRLLEPTYTLTAGVVVVDERGWVLFARHVFRIGSGWGIPGGFVERGEQPDDAARRELREELDLEVSDLRLAFVRTLHRARQVEVIFTARAASSPRATGGEIVEVEWFDPASIPGDVSPDQQSIVRRAIGWREPSPST